MRVMVFGVLSMKGKAKKTGNDYSIQRALVGSPIGAKVTAEYNRIGYGYEVTEVEVEESAIPQFAGHNYPLVLDLQTEMRPIGGKFVPVVIGVTPVKQ